MSNSKQVMRAVVAHPIPAEQQRITAILEQDGAFRVCHTTHDGLECVREVMSSRPELLVMDTVLDKIDGLEVLRRLKEFPGTKTKCLLLTSYGGYVEEYASFLGADYCLMTPYLDGVLTQSVQRMFLPPEACFTDRDIDGETGRILYDIGAPQRLKGYAYVLDCVRVLVRDPELIRRRCVVKELYKTVAAHFSINDAQVERTIRTLTKHVFSKGDSEHIARYFSMADVRQGHITNSDFLAALATLVAKDLTARGDSSDSARAANG